MANQVRCHRTIVLGLVVFMLTTGCAQTNPSVSSAPRHVHYVVIDDGSSGKDIRIPVGAEVRWVNVRLTPVSVVFNGLQQEGILCGHGFFNSTNAHLAAVILPDRNASLCFSTVGRRTYRVLDAQRAGVELNHEVSVEIVPAP